MRVSRMWLDKRHLCMTQNDLRRKTNKVGGNILIIHFMYIHTFREDRSTRRNRVRRMRCVIFLLCVYFSEHIWLVDAHVPYRLFLLRATFCFFFCVWLAVASLRNPRCLEFVVLSLSFVFGHEIVCALARPTSLSGQHHCCSLFSRSSSIRRNSIFGHAQLNEHDAYSEAFILLCQNNRI